MIQLTIDGVKNSTSNYLVSRISNQKENEYYYFGPDELYHNEKIKNKIKNMQLNETNYIIEGGLLSQMVHQMTERIIPTFQVDLSEKRPTVHYDWLSITLKDLADYYKNSFINVIFYISDVESYLESIQSNGKYTSFKEKRDLKVENYLYQHIIETLLIYAPELKNKIILEDISKTESKARFAHYIRVMLETQNEQTKKEEPNNGK